MRNSLFLAFCAIMFCPVVSFSQTGSAVPRGFFLDGSTGGAFLDGDCFFITSWNAYRCEVRDTCWSNLECSSEPCTATDATVDANGGQVVFETITGICGPNPRVDSNRPCNCRIQPDDPEGKRFQ